jgi:ABC-type sugar transport system permease subunit
MTVGPGVQPATASGVRTRGRGVGARSLWEQLTAASFVVPAVVLLAVFLIYPIGYVVYISFHRWGILGDPVWIGLDNYRTIFGDGRFFRAVGVTVYFVALAVLLNTALVGRRWFRTVFFVPMAMSLVAAGLIFSALFGTTPTLGFVPSLLARVGVDFPEWQTTDGAWAMPIVVLMNTWKATGYAMVVYLAGLQSINPDYYEAAQVDGLGSAWGRFRDITWPLLAPTTFLLTITTTIFSFRAFEPFYVMTAGGPAGRTTTLVYYVFERFPNRMGVSSAAATMLLVGVFMLTMVQFIANSRREVYY